MSVSTTIRVYELIATDDQLTNLEKLVLLRWAWKSKDNQPHEIQIKTYARDLNASRDGTRKAVRSLIARGYFREVTVKVVPGQKFLQGGSPSNPPAKEEGGRSATPPGSLSNPQRGRSATPLQTKTIKTRAKGFYSCNAEARCARRVTNQTAELLVNQFSEFQLSMLRRNENILCDNEILKPDMDEYQILQKALNKRRT